MIGNKAFIKKYRYWLLLNGLAVIAILLHAFYVGVTFVAHDDRAKIGLFLIFFNFFLSTIFYQWLANKYSFLFYISWLILSVFYAVFDFITYWLFLNLTHVFDNGDYYFITITTSGWKTSIFYGVIIAYVIEVIIKQIQKPIKN